MKRTNRFAPRLNRTGFWPLCLTTVLLAACGQTISGDDDASSADSSTELQQALIEAADEIGFGHDGSLGVAGDDDESPYFGRGPIRDAFDAEEPRPQVDVDAVEDEAMRPELEAGDVRIYNVLAMWGRVAPTDTEPAEMLWNLSAGVSEGAIRVLRTLRFEPRDRVLPREEPNRIQIESQTLPHVDGIVLQVIVPRDAEGGTFYFSAGSVTLEYPVAALARLDEATRLDRSGNGVTLSAMDRIDPSGECGPRPEGDPNMDPTGDRPPLADGEERPLPEDGHEPPPEDGQRPLPEDGQEPLPDGQTRPEPGTEPTGEPGPAPGPGCGERPEPGNGPIATCPSGFISGSWVHERDDQGGVFGGAFLSEQGEVLGHLLGRFGRDDAGNSQFHGKLIGLQGHFRGFVAGAWGEGNMRGQLFDRDGRQIGELRGQYVQGDEAGHGHFRGAWHALCANNDSEEPLCRVDDASGERLCMDDGHTTDGCVHDPESGTRSCPPPPEGDRPAPDGSGHDGPAPDGSGHDGPAPDGDRPDDPNAQTDDSSDETSDDNG